LKHYHKQEIEPTMGLNELGPLNICLKLEIRPTMGQRKERPTMGQSEIFLPFFFFFFWQHLLHSTAQDKTNKKK
jgi:hypothetical protein